MNTATTTPLRPEDFSRNSSSSQRLIGWSLICAILSAAYAKPLLALMRHAWLSELYSYVVLVPLITIYFLWLKRKELLQGPVGSVSIAATLAPVLPGVATLVAYWVAAIRGSKLGETDSLSLIIFSFVCFMIAGFLLCFGSKRLRTHAFPIGFLIFMVPFPTVVTNWFEVFLQHTSADAASALLSLSGATVFREGPYFHLPGIVIEVAKECSGIHSTLVLFITSLLAGHLFLRSPWKKAALALVVVPLGIARNGFRIFTISWLCVHVDPAMIDSPIHHRGGPIFFILSLVPFLAFLLVLRKSERPKNDPPAAIAVLPGKDTLT